MMLILARLILMMLILMMLILTMPILTVLMLTPSRLAIILLIRYERILIADLGGTLISVC